MTGRFLSALLPAAFAAATLLAGTSGTASPLLGAVGGDGPGAADTVTLTAADSTRIHREARRAQEEFERFRVSQTPVTGMERYAVAPCTQMIFGACLLESMGDDPLPLPSRTVIEGRRQLIDLLAGWGEELPGDGWIASQRVRYLVEAGELLWAAQVAEDCVATGYVCHALRGWVAHEREDWVEAGAHFLDALAALDPRERASWETERWMTDREAQRFMLVDDPGERERRRALSWRLADPLYMVPGNARWTEHMSRITRIRIYEDSENHLLRPWDEGMMALELRYGYDIRIERERQRASRTELNDPHIIGVLLHGGYSFVPAGEVLSAFPDTDEGAIEVVSRRVVTRYTPPYARTFENLTSQTGRFLRDGELFVVHAFARASRTADDEAVDEEPPFDPFGARGGAVGEGDRNEPLPRDLRTALFLLPVDGPVVEDGPRPAVEGEGIEGIWTATVPRGDLILSLEAWSRFESKAWRVRHGLPDLPRAEGRIAASDPIFLDTGPLDEPTSLDGAMEHMLATTRFRSGDLVRIGWEVYGIPEGAVASVSLGLEESDRSLLRRLGEFFRVLEPAEPVTIRWDDAEAERPGTVFRAIALQLPTLDPGRYDLFLEIRVGDEPPAVARRRFHVDP